MCCGVCVCVPFTSSLPGGIATGRQREGRVLASRRGMRSSGLVRFGGGATRADSNAPSKKRSFVFYSSIFWRFHRKVYRYKMQKKKKRPPKMRRITQNSVWIFSITTTPHNQTRICIRTASAQKGCVFAEKVPPDARRRRIRACDAAVSTRRRGSSSSRQERGEASVSRVRAVA